MNQDHLVIGVVYVKRELLESVDKRPVWWTVYGLIKVVRLNVATARIAAHFYRTSTPTTSK